MEKLNELVELAKKATSGDWTTDARNSVVAVNDQVNNGFVICAASGCDKSHNAAFIAAANPVTILAIADAFGALEQRLAELEKQEPIYQLMDDEHWYDAAPHIYYENISYGNVGRIVYARPAPVINLAELVPREIEITVTEGVRHGLVNGSICNPHRADGWNACVAAILRNIAEAQRLNANTRP
ncbi:hypothetical protein F3I20_22050 [Candidatus Pantoea gossypiicola]|uniref:Ead/Ea22-like family protein n=1 Tax=Candidatus Pantoea gossypiicola TaxID=2608008 RepID=A0AB34CEG8_9GAMM|nr:MULTISPECIES: ead/Ea22-like family protein [Pantoea]KAA5979686.1 hypothetical protein F3I49_21665 [Pantoea sp. M_4]KAA6118690.1 hypothetical protein F3I20_22050 [Pantoea gossypiicola]